MKDTSIAEKFDQAATHEAHGGKVAAHVLKARGGAAYVDRDAEIGKGMEALHFG